MTAKNYALRAALVFSVIAALQLLRSIAGWPINVGTTFSVPVWASWIASVVAAGLAL